MLGRQRNRWQRGLTDTLKIHRRMFLNPRFGLIGMVAMPYFVLFEMLGPVIELLGFIILPISFYMGTINLPFFLLFLVFALLLGAGLSTASVILEELTFRRFPRASHMAWLVLFGLLENFGYRQLHSWWRLKGLIAYLRGNKSWGQMQRRGFARVVQSR